MKCFIAIALATTSAHAQPPQVFLSASDTYELRRMVAHQVEAILANERERYKVVGQADDGLAQFDLSRPVQLTLIKDSRTDVAAPTVDVVLEQSRPAARSVRARLFVRRGVRGLIATRTLQRNAPFRCDDFKADFVDVERISAEPVPAPCVPPSLPTCLRNAVSPGQALRASDLRTAPLVVEGEEVPVRVQVAAVLLERRGRALRDAQPGERLTVQLVNSTAPVAGYLGADGVVFVDGASR